MSKNLDINEIKHLYLDEELSINDIAKQLNVCRKTISDRLKKANVQIINRQNISKIDEDTEKLIIKMYTEKEIFVTEITKMINETRSENKISSATVYKCLHKNNIRIINYQNRPKFNQNIFDIIDTEEKAYWLGFIFADGYISSKDNSFELGLKISDKSHLEKFNKFMEHEKYNIKIGKSILDGKTFYNCKWYITNKHLWNTLNSYGCTPRKSLTLRFPDENIFKSKKLIKHFIRGYFDGDGCLSYSKNNIQDSCSPAITLLGTKRFLIKVKELLFRFNIDSRIREDKRNNVWILYFSKKENSYKFLDYIYLNSNIYLSRKYKRYKFLINSPSIEELIEFLENESGEGCDANTVLTT